MVENLVTVEITQPLPETGVANTTYKIQGTVTVDTIIGVPPWVYAEVRKKEWYKPEIVESVSYERGFPIPVTGKFSIDFRRPEGIYEVTVVATPSPLSLPVVGLFPVTGKSDIMKIAVAEPAERPELKILSCSFV